tara:strand:- start:1126 stop:2943 length:1818 start_codon:yes stop_codon:yes gene_type:complete
MSYWKNDELESVKQTSISIPSANGLSYGEGQRVDITIPSNIKMFDGRKSYLNFDIKLGLPEGAPTRLTLDPHTGGSCLIKNIRIYSNMGGRVLLEELVDYNSKVALEYSYDADESLRKMRAIKEGCQMNTPANRGTIGTSTSYLVDTKTSPYFQGQTADYTTAYDATKILTAKCSIPLHTGIFADSLKAFPNEVCGGLYIELDLEDASRCVKILDSVNRHRRLPLNPRFAGIDKGAGLVDWDKNGAVDKNTALWVDFSNNNVSVENFPFVVGESFSLVNIDDETDVANLVDVASAAESNLIITEIERDTTQSNYIKVSYLEAENSATDSAKIVKGQWVMYSTTVDTGRLDRVAGVGGYRIAPRTSYPVSYTMSNVELVVASLQLSSSSYSEMMSGLKNDGEIQLDIISATNYKHSLQKENRQATINLPLSNTRAKSVIVLPTDASVYNSAQLVGAIGTYIEEQKTTQDKFDVLLNSNRSGQVGCIDGLTSYQMIIDDILCPSRPVSVKKANKGLSISAQHLTELDKSLNQSGIVPRSFMDYNRNFCFGRAYSSGVGGVADLRNRTNQIQLQYNETTAPTVNKLLYCWVFFQKRIIVRGNSVMVEL